MRDSIDEPAVGRIAWGEEGVRGDIRDCFLATEKDVVNWKRDFKGLLTVGRLSEADIPSGRPCIHSIRSLSHLKNGDIVVLYPRSGQVGTLFRPESDQNTLLLTERCNSFCLMCSQPPVDRDDSGLVRVNVQAIGLMQPSPRFLGLTGGEPTLPGDDLLRIFRSLRDHLPQTHVHMLTNGRRFA